MIDPHKPWMGKEPTPKGKLIRTCTRDGCACMDEYEKPPGPPRGNPPTRLASRNNAKSRVSLERDRQIVLWGDGPMPMDLRLAILMEEVFEVSKALQDEGDDRVLEELVQVSAVALRWAEDLLLEMKR